MLRSFDVGADDVVAGLLLRTVDLLVAVLATWRLGAVYQPLFTAFGPKAIEHRLAGSWAKVVVPDSPNRPKLDEVESVARIVTLAAAARARDVDYIAAPTGLQPVMRPIDAPFLIMFASGTTGAAKPLYVPLRAIAPSPTT